MVYEYRMGGATETKKRGRRIIYERASSDTFVDEELICTVNLVDKPHISNPVRKHGATSSAIPTAE